jgi:hypothetical protein
LKGVSNIRISDLFRISILGFSIFALASAASASYISLQTSVSSKVVGDQLQVSVSVVNKGDESAYNVQAEIRAGGKKLLARKVQELGINRTYRAQAVFDLDYKLPGEYPLVVVMHYADANMYPFSALTCQAFSFKSEAIPAEIFGSIKAATFWKKGQAKLTLKNMATAAIEARTYLVAPRELTAGGETLLVRVPAKSSARVSFGVENFSALSGSTYQVYAISEYEKDGRHLTSISPGMMKIVAAREILGLNYSVIIALLAGLVLVFIAAQFLRPKK